MSMPFFMKMEIVTNRKEKRREQTNVYELEIQGYELYVMNQEIKIKRTKNSDVGSARILELTWRDGKTFMTYELTRIKSVN